MVDVILVDENDQERGTMEKLEAHKVGELHRAFSIFIFNSKGELLIHKRASGKYHSGGLWTNTCCSHPLPNESTETAAHRRLKEEMGMSSDLNHEFHFVYRADFENTLIEHELDHVFTGTSDQEPQVDANEVSEWKYIEASELLHDIESNPGSYTEWFKLCLTEHKERFSQPWFQT